MTRLRANGHLDPSFSDNGKHTWYVGRSAELNDVAIDFKGRIIAVGDAKDTFGIVRLRGDGSPDRGFSNGGFRKLDMPGGPAPANSVALRPRNRILVFGGTRQFVFARFIGYRG